MLYNVKARGVIIITILVVSLLLYNSLIWQYKRQKALRPFSSAMTIDLGYELNLKQLHRSYRPSPIGTRVRSAAGGNIKSNVNQWKQNSIVDDTFSNQTSAKNVLTSRYLTGLFSSLKGNGRVTLTKEGIEAFKTFKTGNKFIGGGEPYLSERKDLLDRCSEESINPVVDLSRMVYDDKHKIVMCVVPKAACTSWKRVIWYLLGFVEDKTQLNAIDRQLVILNKKGKLPILSRLKTTEALKKLLTYTTFFTSRHPFERLLSAHSSKFTERALNTEYQRHTGRKIAYLQAKKYLKGIQLYFRNSSFSLAKNSAFQRLSRTDQDFALAYTNSMNSGKIPFDQFARFVANEDDVIYKRDIHWRPQTALCNPCALRYDYTIKFERLAQDSNHLLKYVQRFDPEEKQVFFDTRTTALINKTLTINKFSKLNMKTINGLRALYEKDLRILGYENLMHK